MTLTLFTNITEQLTELEKTILVPMLIDTLQHTNTDNRYTARNLSGWFKASGYNVSGPRIRKFVNYIRVANAVKPHVLIGSSTGYYLTTSIIDVDDEIESMRGRVDSGLAVIDALESQRENLKRNQ